MLQITKEEIDTIIRLQDNEDKRKTIHRSLEELPAKFDRLAAEEADIEARLKNKEDYVEKQKKSYRECERELQAKQGKIQKSDAKLLSIKNNKEYQAVLAEIDEFKAKASALEDSMLSILDEIDAAEQALKSEKETS